jgi:hypothetical protein
MSPYPINIPVEGFHRSVRPEPVEGQERVGFPFMVRHPQNTGARAHHARKTRR